MKNHYGIKIQTKTKFEIVPKGSKITKIMNRSKNRRGLLQVKAVFFTYKQTRNFDIL